MNPLNAIIYLHLLALLLLPVQAKFLIGYWYDARACDPQSANGMYVDNVNDYYPDLGNDDAGAVYLTRPGKVFVAPNDDCHGDGVEIPIQKCKAFQFPKRIACVKNTG